MPFTPIRFGSDATHLTVTPIRPLGYGTLCEVSFRAKAFSGSFESAAFLGGDLLQNIQKLYRSLNGSVSLRPVEDDLRLDIIATGRGHFEVKVELVFHGSPEVELRYWFEIDQTFLPPVINALKQNLPLLDPLTG